MDVKHHVYLLMPIIIVQELCESRGGRKCLTSTETVWLIRDGGKGGMEVCVGGGGEGDYIPIATLSPPECFLH